MCAVAEPERVAESKYRAEAFESLISMEPSFVFYMSLPPLLIRTFGVNRQLFHYGS